MDIILTEKSIRKFLQTPASIEDIIQHLCNSGPTVDRYHKVGDDTILEIEIITNRIDSASVFGVAREANAILSQNGIDTKLVNNPYNHKATDYSHQTETLKFTTTDNLLFKRFTAIIIRNVSIKTSPPEIVDLLEKTGQRPINNIVDATNEATLLYGLPTHVFDADKLALQKLLIREARAGETLTTLDETKINLNDGDLIIEDGQNRLVDLCGVMGGQVAVVDEHTTSIVLIAPVYQPKKIRQTSLAHQKRTLAAQIYEKGPDPFLTMPVLDLLIQSIIKRAGGQVTSKIFDQNNYQPKTKNLEIDLNWLSKIAGVAISESQAISILSNLGFLNTHTTSNNVLTTTVPSFRQEDINLREDLAEEIIRIYGYYNLPATLPTLTKMPTATNPIFSLERKLKTILVNTGFNEIYNSSLISKSLIESTEQNLSGHLKLTNSLSEDLEYLRTTLVPSALQNHLNNKGKGSDPLKIFELANVYLPTTDNSPPKEVSTLIFSSTLPVLTLKSILFLNLSLPVVTNSIFLEFVLSLINSLYSNPA